MHEDNRHLPKRRISRSVRAGSLVIGGGAPISVQSMTTTRTTDVEATLAQIYALEKAGCDVVRLAIPDMASAEAIRQIRPNTKMPLVADIHFDWRLAIAAMENGVDKIRLNPGNIGNDIRVKAVVQVARDRKIPIRIGVNAGSLEKELMDKFGGVCVEALIESAMRHVRLLESLNFDDIVISVKSSDVPLTVAAYRLLATSTVYPLHVGITEAGTPYRGIIKSSAGIGALLLDGIGDTIRVSLTGDPVEEIRVAKELLKACGFSRNGIDFISCPTCGRTEINLIDIAEKVEKALEGFEVPLKVAVMGCAVNGPGEARDADIGIAGGKGEALLFRKGVVVRKLSEENIVEELIAEIHKLSEELGYKV